MSPSHIRAASDLTTWRKSTYSGGDNGSCVEIADLLPTAWRKSSHSGGDNASCVEVGDDIPGVVPVRDSKDPEGPALVFPADAWSAFIAHLKVTGPLA